MRSTQLILLCCLIVNFNFVLTDRTQAFTPSFVGGDELSEVFRIQVQEALQQAQLHFQENRGQATNEEVQYYFDQPEFWIAFAETG